MLGSEKLLLGIEYSPFFFKDLIDDVCYPSAFILGLVVRESDVYVHRHKMFISVPISGLNK
jgi:hypothetical protein